MNKRRVLNVLGRIVLTEALLMIPSLAVSLYYGDGDAGYLAATIFPAALLGILCSRIPTPGSPAGTATVSWPTPGLSSLSSGRFRCF